MISEDALQLLRFEVLRCDDPQTVYEVAYRLQTRELLWFLTFQTCMQYGIPMD